MRLASGLAITSRIELVRPLDQGGMGLVWVAEHLTLGCEVAVKFIAGPHAGAPHEQRFQREARLAARIKSPHVVRIFDHGLTDDGQPYIVMELLEGESLAARLERRGPLAAEQVAMLVSQVAEALEQAHGLGIVHRDIKPSNLFLLRSGYELFAKVLDFGIAKQTQADAARAITETGTLVGTPLYMSPEMLLSPKNADHRVDLWALSVVAYHALTGQLPYRGETPAALAFAIDQARMEPPSAHVEGLSAELDAWFKLALSRDTTLRFATAADLSRTFQRAARGEPFSVAPLDPASETRTGDPAAAHAKSSADDEAVVATTVHREEDPWSGGSDAAGPSGGSDDPDEPPAEASTLTSPGAGPAGAGPADPDDEASTITSAPAASPGAPSTFAGATASTQGSAARGARRKAATALMGALGMAASIAGVWHLATEPETPAAGADERAVTTQLGAPSAPLTAPGAAREQSSPPPEPGDTASTSSTAEPPAEVTGVPTTAPHRLPKPRPCAAPRAKPAPPAATAQPTAAAASDHDPCRDPFVRDEQGDLIPKLECLGRSGRR